MTPGRYADPAEHYEALAQHRSAMNQQLIDAAPGMLAALRLTLAELQGPDKPYSSDSYLPPPLVKMIVETIAQAEGRPNG